MKFILQIKYIIYFDKLFNDYLLGILR